MNHRFSAFALTLCIAWHSSGDAQTLTPIPQEVPDMRHVSDLLGEGKYLAALVALEEMDAPHPAVQQQLATVRSFVGDIPGALAAMDAAGSLTRSDSDHDLTALLRADRLNALDAIESEAKNRQIVIINEAHHIPQHRAFTIQLARRLKRLGFQYFAAEAFNPETTSLTKRGYAIRQTGFYTMEPVFGGLVREALAMGYDPVAYEMLVPPPRRMDMRDSINHREQAQADNLVQRILRNDPQAKVLIHCGYSHATENTVTSGDGRQQKWLAARLKESTGIDPLTIDQTEQTEHSRLEASTAAWRLAVEHQWLSSATVFRNPDQTYVIGHRYRGAVDMQIFHPPTQYPQGRPSWLLQLPGRRAVPLSDPLPEVRRRLLIQAFAAGESDQAIPIDQQLVMPSDMQVVLSLPPGEYRLVAQDEQGEVAWTGEQRVE